MTNQPSFTKVNKPLRLVTVVAMLFGMFAPLAQTTQSTFAAAEIVSAVWSGGSGTYQESPSSVLYTKTGGILNLTVGTNRDVRCVEVVEGTVTTTQTSNVEKTSWSFSFTAGSVDGVKNVTINARPRVLDNGKCPPANGIADKETTTTSYVVDNTGPVVTGTLAPAPNAAGWNNRDVTITWNDPTKTTDAVVGITFSSTNPNPNTASVTANGITTERASAVDRLGNNQTANQPATNGSVTVKLDKSLPTISGSRDPQANRHGWNNTDVTVSFECSDPDFAPGTPGSGIKSCVADGTSPAAASKTLSGTGANQSVSGTAFDNADNQKTATVGSINIDKVAPTLSGAPTTAPNGAGWYNSDVTIAWSANDTHSGIVATPANSTISSEGTGLTASSSVSDKAGNTTPATSSPAVKIDKTAPVTSATAPTNWNNVDVTVRFTTAADLSGVAATYYKLNNAAGYTQGTSVVISDQGLHTLSYYSVDNAGNAETAKSIQVKIDKTNPTISASGKTADGADYTAGAWTKQNVTVTFTCGDQENLSGVESCVADGTNPASPSKTISSEGTAQDVTGTATDNAGNTAAGHFSVSIDKTAPKISAAADRQPNGNLAANGKGWYKADVTVNFTCGDDRSGIPQGGCPAAETVAEGANQTASGTATDAAGNTASAGVTGINVDKTAPVLTSSFDTSTWYAADVTVAWSCSDALSGIDGSCPAASTVTGEGNGLSTTESVRDKAGNVKTTTVGGIKIDRTAPSTSASVPDPLASGWYAGAVRVTLTGVDSLSGVAKTYYSVDGGARQEYTRPFDHNLGGEHTITFWSEDVAGNTEDKTAPGHTITLKIDNVKPTITGSRTAANGFGWNNGSVVVTFACSDAQSGIAGCVGDTTVSNEGAGQWVVGTATDNAGNTNTATVRDINIDLTKPTLSGAATTRANAFGWYKGDVTIAWSGQDGLSDIDPATKPANSTISGEGRNLGAGPVTIADKAGNVSAEASVSGIQIDRTAPTITGATVNDDGTPRSANPAGWFNSAVRVRFTCDDTLSTVQECASDVVLDQDGASLSASGKATDRADNEASTTVSGIKLDSQAPKTDADLQCTGKNGYCRGNKATVVLTARDTDKTEVAGSGAGVKEIRYSTNNGSSWTTVTGATATVDLTLNGNGKSKVLFYAVDNAGNSETQSGVEVKYDTMAPAVTHGQLPAANSAGWNNDNVTVTFNANDDSDGSGVEEVLIDGVKVATGTQEPKTTTLSGNKSVTTETSATGQMLNASAEDFAGNVGTDSVTVKLDTTNPTITAQVVNEDGTPREPNANGWYNSAARVRFTCSDALSGIATCPADVVVTTNGANQEVIGTAEDKADNKATAKLTVNVDSVKPTVTVKGVENGGTYILGAVPTATCEATDSGSGLDGACSVTVTGGSANGVGTFNFTATAKDKAGNTTTQSGSYTVIYNVVYGTAFFLQPINDTAHTTGLTTSVFKAGSTVPVKFQLKDANGKVVQANSAPLWVTPAKGSATSEPVSEELYGDVGTTGTTYRWDGQQYIYNWASPKNGNGYYWRVGVKLDDNRTYAVHIGLR